VGAASATRVVASTAGALAALAGLEHGIGELRAGSTPLESLVFASWPDEPAFEIVGGEPAMSLLPTYQASGIATAVVSVALGVWAVGFVHRRHGGLVLVLVSLVLLLVGGGFGPPIMGTIAGLTATRIGKVPDRPPGPLQRGLSRVWRWALGLSVLGFLGLVPGLQLLSISLGVEEPALVLVLLTAAFGGLLMAILGARGHDRLAARAVSAGSAAGIGGSGAGGAPLA